MENVIKIVKSIRIDNKALETMDKTCCILDTIVDELHEIIKEDDYYQNLYDSAKAAWAGLSDFLDAYAERDK